MCAEMLKAHPEFTPRREITWELTEDRHVLWDTPSGQKVTSPGALGRFPNLVTPP